jgi:hypothetical protein
MNTLTSNNRELQAISNSVMSLARSLKWQDCSVRVRTDNRTSMAYINRMGGREPHLTRVAEEVHNFCLFRKIYLTAEYLPGLENSLADKLSRVESDLSESQLHPSLFRMADQKWGPHTLDCFASGPTISASAMSACGSTNTPSTPISSPTQHRRRTCCGHSLPSQ